MKHTLTYIYIYNKCFPSVMNRKIPASLLLATLSQHCRVLSPVVFLQQGSSKFLRDASGSWTWPPFDLWKSVCTKCPPFFIIMGLSTQLWVSLKAAHFSLCIDSDLEKQHRKDPISHTWREALLQLRLNKLIGFGQNLSAFGFCYFSLVWQI